MKERSQYFVNINGKDMSLRHIAKKYNISYSTLFGLYKGNKIDAIIEKCKAVENGKFFGGNNNTIFLTINNETKSLSQWSLSINKSRSIVREMYKKYGEKFTIQYIIEQKKFINELSNIYLDGQDKNLYELTINSKCQLSHIYNLYQNHEIDKLNKLFVQSDYNLLIINNKQYKFHDWDKMINYSNGFCDWFIKRFGEEAKQKIYDAAFNNIPIVLDMHNKYKWQKHRLKVIMNGMQQRCYNKKCKDYHNYGAKGIRIFIDWLENRKTFVDWALNNGYEERLEIDRINANGNYCPENCRWITKSENSIHALEDNNVIIYINYKNIPYTFQELANKYNIDINNLRSVYRNYGEEGVINRIEAIKNKKYKKAEQQLYTINGITLSLHGWAKYFNLHENYFYSFKKDDIENKIKNMLIKFKKDGTIDNSSFHFITVNNIKLSIKDWSDKLGIFYWKLLKIRKEKGIDALIAYIKENLELS